MFYLRNVLISEKGPVYNFQREITLYTCTVIFGHSLDIFSSGKSTKVGISEQKVSYSELENACTLETCRLLLCNQSVFIKHGLEINSWKTVMEFNKYGGFTVL